MQFSKFLKPFGVFSLAVICTATVSSSSLYAQESGDGGDYLKIIAQNTTNILSKVNNLPQYLEEMTKYATSWLSEDDSEETATIQASFANLGQSSEKNQSVVEKQLGRLTADLLDTPTSDLISKNPPILGKLPDVNNMMYASMLGFKPVPKGQFDPYDYVKFAGGLNFDHTIPLGGWQGSSASKKKYKDYYSAIIAVESFNSYVLADLYAENVNGNQVTKLQNDLMKQASSSSWIAKIATEELGKVLRQILMFQSQSYVVLTQLLQTEKKLLTATAMTNTLLIAGNSVEEGRMAARAQGLNPRS